MSTCELDKSQRGFTLSRKTLQTRVGWCHTSSAPLLRVSRPHIYIAHDSSDLVPPPSVLLRTASSFPPPRPSCAPRGRTRSVAVPRPFHPIVCVRACATCLPHSVPCERSALQNRLPRKSRSQLPGLPPLPAGRPPPMAPALWPPAAEALQPSTPPTLAPWRP